jgi:methylase of polypeptide subunit release factors
MDVEGYWARQRRLCIKPFTNRLKRWRSVTYGDTRVHYKKHLDGGGRTFGQDLITILEMRHMPPQRRVFEWCSGPAFIGFSMLARGFAETLCLADVNPEAIACCRRTIAGNNLAGKVSMYLSDGLKDIPASERWDLVVGNPPHFADDWIDDLRTYDQDWRLHREFFAAVGGFLNPGGMIVLQENNRGSTVDTFRSMIETSGLQIVFADEARTQRTLFDRFYYIGITRCGETPPLWAKPGSLETVR